jgi:hypothetical protein
MFRGAGFRRISARVRTSVVGVSDRGVPKDRCSTLWRERMYLKTKLLQSPEIG